MSKKEYEPVGAMTPKERAEIIVKEAYHRSDDWLVATIALNIEAHAIALIEHQAAEMAEYDEANRDIMAAKDQFFAKLKEAQAEIARQTTAIKNMVAKNQEQADEIERLREALENAPHQPWKDQIAYMDWFFKRRVAALAISGSRHAAQPLPECEPVGAIVGRLRICSNPDDGPEAASYESANTSLFEDAAALIERQAAEIERLKAALIEAETFEEIRAAGEACSDGLLTKAQAEIARLRNALDQMANDQGPGVLDYKSFARAALASEGK